LLCQHFCPFIHSRISANGVGLLFGVIQFFYVYDFQEGRKRSTATIKAYKRRKKIDTTKGGSSCLALNGDEYHSRAGAEARFIKNQAATAGELGFSKTKQKSHSQGSEWLF
jgi:hypothetical protein